LISENIINKIRELFVLKNYKEVLKLCEKSINEYPKEAILYNFAGVSWQALQNFSKSIIFFKKAIDIETKNISYLNNLANSYTSLRKYKDAENIYKKALLINDDNEVILNNFASFQKRVANYSYAIELYEKLMNLGNNNSNLLHELAECYQIIGNFEKSKKLLDENININPRYVKSHYTKSFSTNYHINEKHLQEMIEINKINNISVADKILINYALGKAYEDKKDFESSFKYLDQANKLQNEISTFSMDIMKELFKKIKSYFKKNGISNIKKKFNNIKMTFICGLPRSGTTLVSQILTSHSKVNSVGEISLLKKLIDDFFYENNSISHKKINDELKKDTNQLNNLFIDDVNFFLRGKDLNYVVDKTPSNYIWMGLIKILFPNSYIIYCKRNYKDNFLSLFKNNLIHTQNSGWACNPDHLFEHIKMTDDLIVFWKSLDEKMFYEVNYEKLIQNPKNEIQNLLNYCKLDWEENCLNFHKNRKTNVTTLSVHQARQPIYKSSVKSYDNYSKYLGKYFDKL